MKLSVSSKKPLAEINLTPLVDVMMTLLIIFMVTVPLMKHGIDVDLPHTTAKPIPSQEERLIVTIDKEGKVYLDEMETPLPTLSEKLKYIFSNQANKEVFLRADAAVAYGVVVEVLAEIKKAGIEKLGMVTEPLEKKK